MSTQPEQTVEDFAAGSKKLAKTGSMLISLAGGEPLLRDDLSEIVAEVGKFHFPFITTNGWLVTEQLAADLMRAGLWGVSVSIDYATAEKHDSARSMPGAWQQAWRAVEMFSAARVHDFQRVNVIAVLMNDNLDDIEQLISLAAERNAYFMVQPYSHLKTGSKAHSFAGAKVSKRLVELRRKWPNFLSNPWYLSQFDNFADGGVPNCRAGRAFFNIDSTGDIAICVESKNSPVANLYRDHEVKIFNKLREAAKDNNCTQCWYNCRGEVESLYKPLPLLQSLPTLIFDRGKAKTR